MTSMCLTVDEYLDMCDTDCEADPVPATCPYCGGDNTELLSEDELHGEETHLCWTCEVAFIVDVIPW